MPHLVDEVNGHVAGVAALLPVAADAAEVVGVAQTDTDDAGVLDSFQGELRRLCTDHLAEPRAPVDEQNGAVVLQDFDLGVWRHRFGE